MKNNRKQKLTALIGGVCAVALVAGGALAADPSGRGNLMRELKANGEVPVSAFTEEAAARAAALDANSDGVITEAEMKAHREARRAAYKNRRFPDANEDGVVTLTEFQDAAQSRFEKMDANGDGVLSEDEAPKQHGRRHRRGQ